MSNEKQETITDIVTELRRQSDEERALATRLRRTGDDVDYAIASCYDEDAKYLSQIADRIEAAAKRERLPEVRTNGQWNNGTDYEYEFAYCSKCGRMVFAGWNSHAEAREKVVNFHETYKYCPGCGAKMEGGRYVK